MNYISVLLIASLTQACGPGSSAANSCTVKLPLASQQNAPLALVFQESKACNAWASATSGYLGITTSARSPAGSTLHISVNNLTYSASENTLQATPPDTSWPLLPLQDATTSAELVYLRQDFVSPTTIPENIIVTLTVR